MHPSDYTFRESQQRQHEMHAFNASKRFWSDLPTALFTKLTEEQKREAQSQEEVGDGLPLTESEVDKLAERYNESRTHQKGRVNFHE